MWFISTVQIHSKCITTMRFSITKSSSIYWRTNAVLVKPLCSLVLQPSVASAFLCIGVVTAMLHTSRWPKVCAVAYRLAYPVSVSGVMTSADSKIPLLQMCTNDGSHLVCYPVTAVSTEEDHTVCRGIMMMKR